jgi:sulfur relay (sulfurtransferase) complex TusBCD TusD component (DsrE family)
MKYNGWGGGNQIQNKSGTRTLLLLGQFSVSPTTGDELKPLLDLLIKAKVPIYVCTPCANARHMGEEDLIASAKFEKAKMLIALAAESKVFTF